MDSERIKALANDISKNDIVLDVGCDHGKLAKELLDTVDNLERAIAAVGEEKTPLSEGVELTLKGLLNTLEKFGVVVVDTASGFNADLHQAVGIDPNAKANEIGIVLQKGYSLKGRLLRPAMVMVGA